MVGGRWRRAVYSQRLTTQTENVLELQHFEDLPLGEEWTTRRRTVTEADVAAFVGLAGDYNPLYADLEHARSGPYGGPVAPGALVAALTTGLGSMDVPLPATVGMVGMSWKFLVPVQPGDTLGSRWRLSRKRNVENPRWGLAVWQVDVENQRGELVASGEVARLITKREQPAEAVSRSRRRRRKGAPAGQAAADVVMAEPVPEPAPADVPSPSARRRRRRGRGEQAPETVEAREGAEAGEGADAGERADAETPPEAVPTPAAEPPGVPASEPTTPSKRRRRRRSSNGQGGGETQSAGNERQGGGTEPEGGREHESSRPPEVAVETSPPSAPQPAWSNEPRPSPFSGGGQDADRRPEPRTWPVEEQQHTEDSGAGGPEAGGLGRVFRRLRRP
jgi:3-hydroxybutyryl-CoA dehydratase